MTNSHNRASQKEGRNSERNHASPNHNKTNGSRKVTFFSDNNKSNSGGYFQQKHSNNSNNSSSSSSSNSSTNNNNNHNNHHYHSTPPKDIVSSASHNNQKFNNSTPKEMATNNKNHRYNNNRNYHNGSPHANNGRNSPRSPISFASPAGVSRSPPNLYFAGSKYFDAPAPNSLPQPPSHWTSIQSGNIIGSTPTTLSTATITASESTSKRRLFTNGVNLKSCSLSAAAEAAGKNLCSDIFSHNLKLILNVQA